MSDKPKPCPFCGGVPQVYVDGEVGCVVKSCPLYMHDMTKAEWDRRATLPQTAKLVERLGEYRLAPDFATCTSVAVWMTGEEAAAFLKEHGGGRTDTTDTRVGDRT